MTEMHLKPADVAVHFRYLDRLRESGITNMYGASPFLSRQFDLTDRTARKVLTLWMDTYDGSSTPEARAQKALNTETTDGNAQD